MLASSMLCSVKEKDEYIVIHNYDSYMSRKKVSYWISNHRVLGEHPIRPPFLREGSSFMTYNSVGKCVTTCMTCTT